MKIGVRLLLAGLAYLCVKYYHKALDNLPSGDIRPEKPFLRLA